MYNIKKKSKSISTIRLWITLSFIFFISIILVSRLVYLSTFQKNFLENQGDARTVRTVNTPAYRGMLLDRFGQPLAVSTAVATIWANPTIIYSDNNIEHYSYDKLNKILGFKNKYIEKKISENSNKEFIYIKRHIAPDVAEQIASLDLPGIFTKQEFRRYYPNGEVTAHITGFTSIDGEGQEGLEFAYEQELKGKPGSKQVLKDRLGRIIKTVKQYSVAQPGNDITLSIDLRLQYLAYKSLKQAIAQHNALAGVAVLLDVKSGEILALANQPSFNPNDRFDIAPDKIRNRAFTDLFEPGSLLKPLSLASVLSTGLFDSNTMVDTHPGFYKIGKNTVRDVRDFGMLTAQDIIKKSSNVGISKLVLQTDPTNFIKLLYNVGFTAETNINFPGQATGWINEATKGEDFKLATLSYGYGLTVTPMQLIQAYTVFANNGKLKPVTILKQDGSKQKKIQSDISIMSSKVANDILAILNNVMQKDGTGRLAMLNNYEIAGKTGTTRRIGPNGYDEKSHNAMIIGMGPYPEPKLAMLVFIIDPKKNDYYGGKVAGPVFNQVMSRALKLYGATPNKLS